MAMRMRCACRPMQTTQRDFRLKGFRIEENKVLYSTEMQVLHDLSEDKEYIPAHTVQEKCLTPDEVESLTELVGDARWANRVVAERSAWKEEPSGRFTYWILRGEHEYFTAHKIGPNGAGSYLNNRWEEITDIILGDEE